MVRNVFVEGGNASQVATQNNIFIFIFLIQDCIEIPMQQQRIINIERRFWG